MANITTIAKQAYKRATWKNGLGHTDEIAIYPATASLARGDFLWRLSSARIAQGSPFSAFPEHDRTLVVLDGAGLKLTHTFEEEQVETVEVPALSPYDFPGDVPSRCELISGPITDLSVFVRKAEAEVVTDVAEVEPGDTFDWVPAGRWNFAFATASNFNVTSPLSGGTLKLAAGDTLAIELDEPLSEEEPVRLTSASGLGKLVLVSIQG